MEKGAPVKALLELKVIEKVTEKGSLSPYGRGNERKGNRGRLSKPIWKRKRAEREQRRAV